MARRPEQSEKEIDMEEQRAKTKTCFVMMPISDVDGYPPGHFEEVYEGLIKPAVEHAGFECELATSTSAAHFIPLDIVTKAATADLCVCDLSTRNANVLFEYGIRQAFDKPTVLVKDDKTPALFDVAGFRYVQYKHTMRIQETMAARLEIAKAIQHTVDGSGDEAQVFSLVTMMKLTKAAALPPGNISKDDARFSLLERKLDQVISFLSRANDGGLEKLAKSSAYPSTLKASNLPGLLAPVTANSDAFMQRLSGERAVAVEGLLNEMIKKSGEK